MVAPIRRGPGAPFDPTIPDTAASYLVQNAKVIGVGQATDSTRTTGGSSTAASSSDRGLITVAVDPVDAERIAFAQTKESIYLVLVGPGYTAQALPYVGEILQLPPLEPLNRGY